MPINVLFLHGGDGGEWDRTMRGSEHSLLTLLVGLDRREIIPFLHSGTSILAELADAKGVETEFCPMPVVMIDGAATRLQFRRRWHRVPAFAVRLVERKLRKLSTKLLLRFVPRAAGRLPAVRYRGKQ